MHLPTLSPYAPLATRRPNERLQGTPDNFDLMYHIHISIYEFVTSVGRHSLLKARRQSIVFVARHLYAFFVASPFFLGIILPDLFAQ